MAEREDVLEAWQAAGTDLVMLPSGTEVRLDLPALGDLVSRGAMPATLSALAANTQPEDAARHDRTGWDELVNALIVEAVVGIRPPGFADVEPHRITLEELTSVPPRLPRSDLVALEYLVLRFRTPRQQDAFSRMARGLMPAEEAQAIIAAERPRGLFGWAPFRPGRDGAELRPDGEDVGQPAEPAAGDRGSGGRVRHRRGARVAARAPQAASAAPRGG